MGRSVEHDPPAVPSDAEQAGFDALTDGMCSPGFGVAVDRQHVRPGHGFSGQVRLWHSRKLLDHHKTSDLETVVLQERLQLLTFDEVNAR